MASVKQITISWKTAAGETRTAKRYKARFRDDDGKEHAKLFPLKRDAEKWIRQNTAALVRGDFVDPVNAKTLVREYAEGWEKVQIGEAWSRNVDNALRLHVLPVLGSLPIGKVQRSHVLGLVKALEEKRLAPSTISNIYTVTRTMFDAAIEDRVIPATPCRNIKLPSTDDEAVIPTVAEVEKVREALDERWRAVATVLVGSGVRIGELLGLTVADVNFLKRTVQVKRQRTQQNKITPTKGKRSRTVPVGQVMLDALAAHLKAYPAGDESLFVDELGRPLTYRRWKTLLTNAAESAGVDVTSHSFRHFAASALISHGASVKAVQEFLGHADATTTLKVYAHLFPGDEERTRTALDEALASLADSTRTVEAANEPLRRSDGL
jgi:integrase